MKNLDCWVRRLIKSSIFCLYLDWKRKHILDFLVSERLLSLEQISPKKNEHPSGVPIPEVSAIEG